MTSSHDRRLARSFRAVFMGALLWNTQPHLVVFTLLFLQKGISLSQFLVMHSIGAITSFILEVPTGVLADRLGRKLSVLASLALALIINPLFILSDSLWVLYGAGALGGICDALRSGADEALFYDSLKAMHREDDYTRLHGRLRWWSGYAGIAASIMGGLVGSVRYELAWWCWEAIVALAFISTLYVVEPAGPPHTRAPTVQAHLIESLRIAFRSHARYFVLYGAGVWFFFSTNFWLWQPYLRFIGVEVHLYGFIFALTGVASGFGARLVSTLERWTSLRILLSISIALLAITLTGQSLCSTAPGLFFLLLHSFASGIFWVVAENAVHSRIESSTRATVLSVKNMISSLLFAALSPLVGLIADTAGLPFALQLLGCGVALVGVVFFLGCPSGGAGAGSTTTPPLPS